MGKILLDRTVLECVVGVYGVQLEPELDEEETEDEAPVPCSPPRAEPARASKTKAALTIISV